MHLCSASPYNIMRAGRWTTNDGVSLNLSYIGSIVPQVGTILAGFTKDTGSYVVPWRCLAPPLALQRKVFPWLEEQLEAVLKVRSDPKHDLESELPLTHCPNLSHFAQINATLPPSHTMVANPKVLIALSFLRIVLLQGAAVMKHPLFAQERVFNRWVSSHHTPAHTLFPSNHQTPYPNHVLLRAAADSGRQHQPFATATAVQCLMTHKHSNPGTLVLK
jgi:hypothetical protein